MRRNVIFLLIVFVAYGLYITPQTPEPTKLLNITETVRFLMEARFPVMVEIGNLYQGYQIKFTEPFEIAYFIFKHGVVIKITNQLVGTVIMPDLTNTFNKLGLKYEDLTVVIHNHLYPTSFSTMDKRFYSGLKDRGFNGSFMLYISPTKKVYELKTK